MMIFGPLDPKEDANTTTVELWRKLSVGGCSHSFPPSMADSPNPTPQGQARWRGW